VYKRQVYNPYIIEKDYNFFEKETKMEKLLKNENGIIETVDTSSDDSKVYNVRICTEVDRSVDTDIKIACVDLRQAEKLANLLRSTVSIGEHGVLFI
jgi:DNA-binding LacI/PurR family transcriptional regulator